MKRLMFFLIIALFAGISVEAAQYVAIVETEVDASSDASAAMNPAEVREITAELRRQASENLPPNRYNIMTSETVQSLGGAVLEECAEENCVITLGSKIGADYIVRGTISKFQTRFTLTVEMYETEYGTLVLSSEAVRTENIGELLDKAAAASANMYKKFASTRDPARKPLHANSPPQADAPTTVVFASGEAEKGKDGKGKDGSVERKHASLTYASWNKFPPKDAGKGEVRIGIEFENYLYQTIDYHSVYRSVEYLSLNLKVRYSIIQGLEASVSLPIPLERTDYRYYNEINVFTGQKASDEVFHFSGYAGLSHPMIGVRYWLPTGLGFFCDVRLPIDTRDTARATSNNSTTYTIFLPVMRFEIGAQYSTNITKRLSFGSQFGLRIQLENQRRYKQGMDMDIDLELDYSIGMVTLFCGINMLLGITAPTFEGHDDGEVAGMGANLLLGSKFNINKMFSADVYFSGVRFGSRYDGQTNAAIGAGFSFNF